MKILTFAGRIHHFQRLSPIVNALRQKGHEALYLISDNCINNDTASEYLIPANEKFIDTLRVLELSDTPRISEMTQTVLRSIYSAEVAPAEDVTFFHDPFWIAYSVREAIEFVHSFRRTLSIEKPEAVMILHGGNFWGAMVAYLCLELKVPCIAYQEGMLRHRDQKTMNKQALVAEYPSRLLVWSESSRQAYIQSGIPDDKIRVVGIPHMDFWFQAMRDPNWQRWRTEYKQFLGFRPDLPLVTFALPVLSRYDGSPKKAIGALADWSANNFIPVAFRFHPFEAEQNVLSIKQALARHDYARVVEGGDTLALLVCSDLAISQHSTVAVETLALNVPLAEIDLDNVGVLESLSERGVAHSIRVGEMDKIRDILDGKHQLNNPDLSGWIEENVGPRDGKAIERVLLELEQYA